LLVEGTENAKQRKRRYLGRRGGRPYLRLLADEVGEEGFGVGLELDFLVAPGELELAGVESVVGKDESGALPGGEAVFD
jgi:hypothetical protein